MRTVDDPILLLGRRSFDVAEATELYLSVLRPHFTEPTPAALVGQLIYNHIDRRVQRTWA